MLSETRLKSSLLEFAKTRSYLREQYYSDLMPILKEAGKHIKHIKYVLDRLDLATCPIIAFDLDETLIKNSAFKDLWDDPIISVPYDFSTYIPPTYYFCKYLLGQKTFHIYYVTGRHPDLYAKTLENLETYNLISPRTTLICTTNKARTFSKLRPIIASIGDQDWDHPSHSYHQFRTPRFYSSK